jgi:hypothetical protein
MFGLEIGQLRVGMTTITGEVGTVGTLRARPGRLLVSFQRGVKSLGVKPGVNGVKNTSEYLESGSQLLKKQGNGCCSQPEPKE